MSLEPPLTPKQVQRKKEAKKWLDGLHKWLFTIPSLPKMKFTVAKKKLN